MRFVKLYTKLIDRIHELFDSQIGRELILSG